MQAEYGCRLIKIQGGSASQVYPKARQKERLTKGKKEKQTLYLSWLFYQDNGSQWDQASLFFCAATRLGNGGQ